MLNAPLGPLGPLCGTARHSCPVCTIWATGPWDVVASVVFALFVFVLTFSCCYFPFLQGRCAFASKVAHLRDPELRKLAEGLPLRAAKAKASSTTERYSRAFQKFREWSACFEEVVCLPSDELSVALYLEFLLQQSFPYSALESACYGINWAHNLYGFPSPCDSKLVRNVLEAAKRELAKPVVKKEPVTPEMISSICNRFAGPNANLSDLRLAAICVTAYSAFLRYNELASLRCCDVSFCDTFVKIYVFKSKTDVYRDGAHVLLAKSDSVSCPFHLLNRYVSGANLDLSSSLPFFRSLHFHKVTSSYSLRSAGMSYTRTREIVLQAFAELGYPKHLFGLHSLRAGGASAAANAGVSDRLFKRHGRWKTDRAKDGYIKDSLESLLSVSKSLHT